MVDVPTEVEREVLGQQVHRLELARRPCLGGLFQGGVGALDVGGVVLGVVQLHDLTGDVRLQRAVVVRQVRQGVFSHAGLHWCGDRSEVDEHSVPGRLVQAGADPVPAVSDRLRPHGDTGRLDLPA